MKKAIENLKDAWLDLCIETYGLFLMGADKLIELGRLHHEAIKNKNKGSGRTDA